MRGMFERSDTRWSTRRGSTAPGAWRTLLGIMLPLVRNGIVVVIIVNFVAAWGEYLLGITLTNDQAARTLPVVLATRVGGMGHGPGRAWPPST